MGRKSTWSPHVLTFSERLKGEMMRLRYTSTANKSITKKYRLFCGINGISLEQGLTSWIGQMLESGLSPGTVDTYVQTVIKALPVPNHSSEAYSIGHAAAAFHTHVGGRGHAVDFDQATAEKILDVVEKDHEEEPPIFWAMMITGMRPSCLDRLFREDIAMTKKFSQQHLHLKVRFTKGIRKTRKRREMFYPMGELHRPPRLFMSKMKKRLRPLSCTAQKLNATLKEVCSRMKIKRITCGSFRRLFSKRIGPYCEEHGISVSDMMLHVSSDMEKAHYTFDSKV